MATRVLLVEPDAHLRQQLLAEAALLGRVDDEADFEAARTHLLSNRYDWVVTNLRLNAHNGLHLVHLAAAARLRTRILVYTDHTDVTLAREVKEAGAFYESQDEVQRALPAYLCGMVPPQDRRDVENRNGQPSTGNGRRSTDAETVSPRIPTC
jgi:DNA-binding NtrC family response regulator